MSTAASLRASIVEMGRAVRRPEELATRWRDRATGDAPPNLIFVVMLANAVFGVAVYGLVMQIHGDASDMLSAALRAPLAAGAAWAVALPALYIINSAIGSKLDRTSTLLAASITVSFGALAMLASVPITWFFTSAIPETWARVGVNVVVFTGVGIAMTDTFLRVMRALEPTHPRTYAVIWLGLVGAIGLELFVLLDVFSF